MDWLYNQYWPLFFLGSVLSVIQLGVKKGSICPRWTACYIIITIWIRPNMLHATSLTSFELQNRQISIFLSSAQKGLLRLRMSHGMHQTHITTPSAPVLLWCLWEQTVLVLSMWDVCLLSPPRITTWPQLTPSAESKSVTSFELYRSPELGPTLSNPSSSMRLQLLTPCEQ